MNTSKSADPEICTQVVPGCLESSGLLDCAVDRASVLSPPEVGSNMTQLAAVHVLGGALSLSRGRSLFPRSIPTDRSDSPAMVRSFPLFCTSFFQKQPAHWQANASELV